VQGSDGARAYVTGYTLSQIAPVSTEVPVGSKPMLPATVTQVFSDGTTRDVPITWDAVDTSHWGRFAVHGSVAGAVATVTVTNVTTPNVNLARSGGSADAGFSGANATIPSAMLDGTTTTGGWSSAYNKAATALLPAVSRAHASEWISIGWPSAQTVSSLRPYFTTSTTRAFPSAFDVRYWDGGDWRPVSNLVVTQAAASNQPSTLAFDPVNTTKLKVEMTTPAAVAGTANGFFQITELEAVGQRMDPALVDLKVAGRSVPGFDPAVTQYGPIAVQYNATPQIVGTPADGETVSVALPASLPGTANVTVTSADGSASRVYNVDLIPADIHDGTVGGTVPATLSLTLGAPASFGAFTAGVAHTYEASTTANVTSTAGDATLSVSDPGHLTNGAFSLPQPLQVLGVPRTWSAPVSNDAFVIGFKQDIGANDALRTGVYSKTLTFTLSTTTP
jgi:hypothetical protein